MKRSDVTYGQLDNVLRSFGFSCRPANNDPPGRIYEHKKTGAMITLPTYAETEKVFKHHMAAVQIELDNFGIADPTTLASKFQKTAEAFTE